MSNIIDQAVKIVEANGFKDSTYRLRVPPLPTISLSLVRTLRYFETQGRCRVQKNECKLMGRATHEAREFLTGFVAPDQDSLWQVDGRKTPRVMSDMW